MQPRRHVLTLGVVGGLLLATGLAFAEPSRDPSFESRKAFGAPSSPATALRPARPTQAAEGNAFAVRGRAARQASPEGLSSDYPRSER
jgi:hypothetical protein